MIDYMLTSEAVVGPSCENQCLLCLYSRATRWRSYKLICPKLDRCGNCRSSVYLTNEEFGASAACPMLRIAGSMVSFNDLSSSCCPLRCNHFQRLGLGERTWCLVGHSAMGLVERGDICDWHGLVDWRCSRRCWGTDCYEDQRRNKLQNE